MPRLVTVSRAARLAGVTRGTLQKRIQDGEIQSFEGMVNLEELVHHYPRVGQEKDSILERMERIIDNAAVQARSRKTTIPPDMKTLARRVNLLSDELTEARLEVSIFYNIIDKLKARLNGLAQEQPQAAPAIRDLQAWLLNQIESLADKKFELYPMLATDTFLRIMAAQVRLEPSGHEFFVEGSNSILEAGLSAGLALNYGCSNGNCGKCKSRIVSGETRKIRHHDFVLSEKEKVQGYILACSHTAVTDLVLEAEEAGSENDIPTQSITAWVRKLTELGDNFSTLHVKTPRTQRLRFLAGQTVHLSIPGGPGKTLHVASCPCDDMHLQFLIEHNKGDEFSDYILEHIRPNDAINIDGPSGHFVLHEDLPNPIVFIAFENGFAPVKSLIEHALTLEIAETISLYRPVPNEQALYSQNQCRAWTDAFEHFNYYPLVNAGDEKETISLLVKSLQQQVTNLNHPNYYIAGSMQEVSLLKEALSELGVPQDAMTCEVI